LNATNARSSLHPSHASHGRDRGASKEEGMKISLRATLFGLGFIALAAALWARGASVHSIATNRVGTARPGDVVRTAGVAPAAGLTGFDATNLSNRDLAIQSDLIVIGQAVDTRVFWADAGRNLFTLVTIATSETLKGDASATVTVALPGGIDANRNIPIAMTYPGAPRIAPEEEVFLFLSRADDEVTGAYAVTGFAQGKFSIETAGAGPGVGSRALAPDQVVKVVSVGGTRVPLSTFKAEISGYLQ
jgi:hypothetical protein